MCFSSGEVNISTKNPSGKEAHLVDSTKSGNIKVRNSEATKEAILQAAHDAFASAPYEKVNLRSIAKDAGIDVALVNRYFGCKKDLFRTVLNASHKRVRLPDGVNKGNLAEKLAAGEEGDEDGNKKLLMMGVYSMTDPEVRLIIQEASMNYLVKPLAKIIGGEKAKQKALLITSMKIGLTMSSEIVFTEVFNVTPKTKKTLQAMIQLILDES